jgi:hypothetical protein
VRHYLEAVARAGTDDTQTVMKAMRAAPIRDVFTDNGTIRADGRVLYDRYLMQPLQRGDNRARDRSGSENPDNSTHRRSPPSETDSSDSKRRIDAPRMKVCEARFQR